MVDVHNLLDIEGVENQYKTCIEAFDAEKDRMRSDVFAYMESTSVGITLFADRIRINKGDLSRRLKGDRKFSLPLRSLLALCYDELHISCHEFLFGVPKEMCVTKLPNHLNVMAQVLLGMNKADALEVERYARTLSSTAQSLYTYQIDYDVTKTFKERISCIANDKALNPYYVFFPKDVPPNVKMSVLKRTTKSESVDISLNSIMYCALMLETTVDYIIAPDFCVYTSLSLKDGTIITHPVIKRIIGIYLRLPSELQTDLYARVLTLYWTSQNKQK